MKVVIFKRAQGGGFSNSLCPTAFDVISIVLKMRRTDRATLDFSFKKKTRYNLITRFEDTLPQRSIIEAKTRSPLIDLAVVCTVIVLNYS